MIAGLTVVGLPVVEPRSSREYGRVRDLLVDDLCTRVVAFLVRRGLFRRASVLPVAAVRSFSSISLTAPIHNSAVMQDGLRVIAVRKLYGRPVVSIAGTYLGDMEDLYFDECTGQILGYELADTVRCPPGLIRSGERAVVWTNRPLKTRADHRQRQDTSRGRHLTT
jgi:uncharacterized protein YrrD